MANQAQRTHLAEMARVRRFFEALNHADTFRYCLNLNRDRYPGAPSLAASTIVVCIDTEGWDASSHIVKELGINTFDSRDMAHLTSPGPWGMHIMKNIYFYFARIQKHAHLKNKNCSAGDPETNRFGQMRFLNDREIIDCLKDTFEWPLENVADGAVRPVVLLGHALDNDVEKIEKYLGFDLMAKGNLVKQIDTQVIARDVGHWDHPNNQIGLLRLVNNLGFEYRDAHTASNDAAMTTIAAVQLVLSNKYKGADQPKTLQDVVDQTERDSQNHNWSHGSKLFCFRCGSREHMVNRTPKGYCQARVRCTRCAIERPNSQWGHRSETCVMTMFETSNSSRPNPNRRRGRQSTASQADVSAHNSTVAAGVMPVQAHTLNRGIQSTQTRTLTPTLTPTPTNSWANIAARPATDATVPARSSRGRLIARPAALRPPQRNPNNGNP